MSCRRAAARRRTSPRTTPRRDEGPSYSPDGRYLAYSKQTHQGLLRRHQAALARRSQVATRAGASPQTGTARSAASPGRPTRSRSTRRSTTRRRERIYRFDVAKGTQHALTTSSSFSSLAIAGKPATLVALRQSFTEPPTLVAVSTKDGAATKLSDHNDAAARRDRLRQGRERDLQGRGRRRHPDVGRSIRRASTRRRNTRSTCILHGGPHNGVYDSWTFRWNARGVLELGLRDGLAQLPRLERLRPGIHRLDQPGRHHAALRGHDQGRGVVRRRSPGSTATAWPRAAAATAASWRRRCSDVRIRSRRSSRTRRSTTTTRMYGGDYGAEKNRFFEAWDKPEECGEVLAARRAPRTSRRRRS